jgi:hypothetical protein
MTARPGELLGPSRGYSRILCNGHSPTISLPHSLCILSVDVTLKSLMRGKLKVCPNAEQDKEVYGGGYFDLSKVKNKSFQLVQ